MNELQLIKTDLLPLYLDQVQGIAKKLDALKDAEISTDTFSFYTSVASVYSSKIEGVDIELDSYIKHKAMHLEFKPDYTKKTDDLYNAYQFAKSNPLNTLTISVARGLLSKNIDETHKQGELRSNIMYVITDDGRIEYIAASPYELKAEMDKWYADLDLLRNTTMSAEEVFFYAAMLHLTFVKIHPWNDGNGRSARLIEKWFIAEKLGEKAWFLQS
jgi:Fic family protein